MRREGEREAPRDSGSATAGCYVTAPPALSPHGLSRLSPIPHPADAARFLPPPPSHMAPHMAPLLSLSLTRFSTHSLYPRGATSLSCLSCHSVSLCFCFFFVCLSAAPSLIISISRRPLPPSQPLVL